MQLITIELIRQTDLAAPLRMEQLRAPLFGGDSEAHLVRVAVVRGGEAVPLAGCTAAGYFLRADGATVVIPGETEGNEASLSFPRACYEVPGSFSFILRLTEQDGPCQTVFALQGSVAVTCTEAVVDATGVIPSLDDLLAQIAALEMAIADADALQTELRASLEAGEFDGRGLTILGYYETAEALSAIDAPQRGDAYCVGAQAPYDVYVWDGVNGAWVNNGPLKADVITVNGVAPVEGDIPLPAESIPCGDTTVAAALAALSPVTLWEGSWASGAITVPGVSDWLLLRVATSVGSVLCTGGSVLQGVGGSVNASLHRTVAVRISVDGDACTLVTAHYMAHTAAGDHGDMNAVTVTAIQGLIRKEA